MKLNHDCVRDILLFIEDNYIPGKILYIDNIIKSPNLKKYTDDEIKYALARLSETNYTNLKLIMVNGLVVDGTCGALTWQGHEFLDNIRGSQAWNYAKKTAKTIGSASISILASLAESYIKSKFNLQ